MPFPVMPNYHALAVLILTGIALFLFTREKLPLESSSLAVLCALALGFTWFPFIDTSGEIVRAVDFFHGFGHEALVAVSALMIIGHGVVRTGALEPVGRGLAKLWKWGPAASLLATLLVGAILSALSTIPRLWSCCFQFC